jgi:hypothetical protein
MKGQGEEIFIADPITFYQRHLVQWLAIRKRIANSGHKFIVPFGYLQSVLSKGDPKQLWIQLLKQQFSWSIVQLCGKFMAPLLLVKHHPDFVKLHCAIGNRFQFVHCAFAMREKRKAPAGDMRTIGDCVPTCQLRNKVVL